MQHYALQRSYAVSILLCMGAVLFVAPSWSFDAAEGASEGDYLQSLVARARHARLADERLWHLLLHYKPTLAGGVESEADGKDFFLHPAGKVDPQAELAATLAAFFSDASDRPRDVPEWQHPQCRFPARYAWLKSRLAFDPRQLHPQPCPRFESWRHALDPGSVSLIFASHYLSNPASMFGHTLLRLNHRRRQGAQNLLDYGVNYAAITTTRNGFLYAILGITGGFEGRFSSFPYYMKVQEYGNLESRDLWEYDLQFSQEQVDRLLQHLWELGNTYFQYFFFQENCSYHILSLLEVANPDLRLTDRFTFTVIPSDTVRLVTKQPGLVSKVVYRPSILSQFAQKRRAMGEGEISLLQILLATRSLERLDTADLDSSRKALILDAAIDIVQHQKLTERDKLSPEDRQFAQALLMYRSQLSVPTPAVPQTPSAGPPESGHGSSRLRLAGGVSERVGGFLELSYPSFHDLLDPEEGFPPYSHLELFTPTVRYYLDIRRFDLERFDAVRIVSLSPINAFLIKPSWQVNVGYQTLRDQECHLCHWFRAEVGTGITTYLGRSESGVFYVFGNIEAGAAKAFDPDFRLAPGVTVGSIMQPLPPWRVHVKSALYYPAYGGRNLYYRNALHHHLAVGRNLGFRFELNHFKAAIEGLAALQIHF